MKFVIVCMILCLTYNDLHVLAKKSNIKVVKYVSESSQIRKSQPLVTAKRLKKVTEMVDSLIKHVSGIINKYMNPLYLEDQSFAKYSVAIELWNIRVANLSQIKRNGSLKIYDNKKDGETILDISIQVRNLQILSDFNTFIDIPLIRAGNVDGEIIITVPEIIGRVLFVINWRNLEFKVDELDLKMDGNAITVEFDGSRVGALLSPVFNTITTFLKEKILYVIGDPLHAQLDKIMVDASTTLQKTMESFLK